MSHSAFDKPKSSKEYHVSNNSGSLYTHYPYSGNIMWIEVTIGLAHKIGVMLLFDWCLSQSLCKTYLPIRTQRQMDPLILFPLMDPGSQLSELEYAES